MGANIVLKKAIYHATKCNAPTLHMPSILSTLGHARTDLFFPMGHPSQNYSSLSTLNWGGWKSRFMS
ncbi:hypothetical protein CsSME_00006780 [Camellia sinensis var. sinensis]